MWTLFNKIIRNRNSVCRGQVISESSTSLPRMNTRVWCSSGHQHLHGLIEKILHKTTLLFLGPSMQQPGKKMQLIWTLIPQSYYKSEKPTWHLAEGRESKAKCSLSFGFVGIQTQYISHCELQVKILILEFAALGGCQTLTGNGAWARKCAFLTLRNAESPRKLGKLTKDCSLELCRGSHQNPEVCLQIPCCSYQRLLQTPDLLCSVKEGLPASVRARSSPVKQEPVSMSCTVG